MASPDSPRSFYYLPCRCGQKTAIEKAQAGGQVTCVCGRRLDVPTMQAVLRLEPVPPSRPAASSPRWGWPQRIALLGGAMTVVWLAVLGYLVLTWPKEWNPRQASPAQALEYWEQIRRGINLPVSPAEQHRFDERKTYHYATWLVGVLLAAAGAATVVALAVGRRAAQRRLGPASEHSSE